MFFKRYICTALLLFCKIYEDGAYVPADSLGIMEAGGKKFWVSNRFQLSYHDASKACRRYGMELLSIEDSAKQYLVNNIMSGFDINLYYWTSGHKLNDDRNWVWAKGVPITYARWRAEEPNNLHGNENCIAMYEGLLIDEVCDTAINVICESVDNSGRRNATMNQRGQQRQTNCPRVKPIIRLLVQEKEKNGDNIVQLRQV